MKKIFLVGILLFSMALLFAGTPHPVYIGVTNAVGDVTFVADILETGGDTIDQNATGCDWNVSTPSCITVQCGSFVAQWNEGETLHVEAIDASGATGSFDCTLTTDGFQYFPDAITLSGGEQNLDDAILTVSSADVDVDDVFTIAISTTELLEDWGVTSFQFDLHYDDAVVQYSDYDIDDLITDGGMVAVNDNQNDVITVGYAGTTAIIGSGDIIILEFVALAGGTTALEVTDFIYNTTEINSINNGSVTVTGLPPVDFETPENVQVDPVTGTMSWFPPAGSGDEGWLAWDDGTNSDGIGLTGGGTFSVASRWTAENLGAYNGMLLSTVKFFPRGNANRATFVVKVWTGENATTLILEQEITATLDIWNEVVLDTPITIDATEELWFGYTIVDQLDGEFPAGTDAGPAIAGYGDMISMDGESWDELSGFGLDYNWNIQGFVENADRKTMPMIASIPQKRIANPRNISELTIGNLAQVDFPTNRNLTGYNIFLDGVQIETNISVLEYTFDLELDTEHVAGVSAVYTDGESEIVEVTFTYVGELPVPSNLQVVGSGSTIIWEAPSDEEPGESFSEDFEGGTLPAGWLALDEDGDGFNWVNTIEQGFDFDAYEGAGAMTSASYDNDAGALTPDNWLISPAITIGSSSVLSYWHDAQDAAWSDEYYYVKVSTSGNGIADFTDVIWEGVTPDDWAEVSVNLSAYTGQTIYLAWHHTDVTDMFWMKLDNVVVTDATRDFLSEYNVYLNGNQIATNVTETTYTFDGLVGGVSYTADVTALYDEGESDAATVTWTYSEPTEVLPVNNLQVNAETGELTWEEPGEPINYFDDFEAYAVGDYLAVEAEEWTTWTQQPGSGEDAFITDAEAFSPTNSVLVEGGTDLILPMGNKATGTYVLEMDLYIPMGFGGYYNLQHYQNPGTEWACEFYFGNDGNGEYSAANPEVQSFTHPMDEWFAVKNIINLDTATGQFFVNGAMIVEWDFSLDAQGDAGINQLGGLDMFAGAITGQTPKFYFDDVHFYRDITRSLEYYQVYIGGAPVGTTENLNYLLTGLTPETTYVAGVSAVYDNGESEIIEVEFYYDPADDFFEPENVTATVVNFNEVDLAWEAPGGGSAEWLGWDSGENAGNAIGLTDGGNFLVASHWDAADITEYNGMQITRLMYFPASASEFTLKVWTGANASNEVLSQVVTPIVGEFNEVVLTTPVTINASQELWFGYETTHAAGDYPAGTDGGPAIAGYGDMISMDGATWDTLSGYGLDYNWNMQAYVVGRNGETVTISRKDKKVKTASIQRETGRFTAYNSGNTTYSVVSRSLAGYKVYCDDAFVGQVDSPTTLTYHHDGVGAGTHEYFVVSYYTLPEGESVASNVAEVNVVLPSPTNLNGNVSGSNVVINWSAPSRGLENYTIYRNGGEIAAGVVNAFYVDMNVENGTYIYTVAAVYTGGYSSEPSEGFEVTVGVAADDPTIPDVTVLNGNYPNPFSGSTAISFSLKETGNVSIDIYNMKGQLVKTLVDNELAANNHSITWNGRDNNNNEVSSGMYFYKMSVGNEYSSIKKMVILK